MPPPFSIARMIPLQRRLQLRLAWRAARRVPISRLWNYARFSWISRPVTLEPSKFTPRIFCCLVTRRCNLKCSWCLTPEIHNPNFELSTETLAQLLAHPAVSSCVYVAFSGGEPLLLKDFPAMIERTRRLGHLTGMTTNGMLLLKRIDEIERAGIDEINVSIYEENFAHLVKILPEVNKIHPVRTNKIILRSTLEKNPDEIEQAIRMSAESGCLGTVLFFCLPHGGSLDEVVYDDNPAFESFKKQITAKYPGYAIAWPEPVKRQLQPADKICRFPWSVVIADADGNLGPCCNFYPNPADDWGSLLANRSLEVLNQSQWTGFRRDLLSPDPALPSRCTGCYAMSDHWYANQ